MTPVNPLYSIDFYKLGHIGMAPDGTELTYINLTPRFDQYAPVDRSYYDGKVVVFAIQAYLKDLATRWYKGFFSQPLEVAVAEFKRDVDAALFQDVDMTPFIELHNLGYLPLEFRALEEGTLCPMGVPLLTLHNTLPKFHWLPTFLETDLSAGLWHAITNATIARNFRMILEDAHKKTGTDGSFVVWQGHDFSARGLENPHAAGMSGMGHLLSFLGTDTVMAIPYASHYYHAESSRQFIGHSVNATEHSVTCMGGQADERATYKRWMEKYPTGILANVLDTWDYWNAINVVLPSLKAEIMARDGKYVVRPDSGDPVEIVCGTAYPVKGNDDIHALYDQGVRTVVDNGKYYRLYKEDGFIEIEGLYDEEITLEMRGTVDVLAEHFGTTTNAAGFKTLDSHIGLIYGDSINTTRARQILDRLAAKGFAADNIVFGIGSYTYQYTTRDTFGFAVKATYCIVNGEGRNIQKDPKTGDGKKKSATGILKVVEQDGTLVLLDKQELTPSMVLYGDFDSGLLKTVWRNGYTTRTTTLSAIRKKLWNWNDSK